MQSYLELEKIYYKISNLKFANDILNWDNRVMMPNKSGKIRSTQITVLENLIHELQTSPEMEKLIGSAAGENLNSVQQANLARIQNIFIHAKAVPAHLVEKYSHKSLECENLWRKAKKENDFENFAPHLQELVSITKEVANYKSEKLGVSPYEALMDLYDPGRKVVEVENIFARLESFLPDFIKKVISKRKSFLPFKDKVPIALQERLGKIISEKIGLDYDYARLDQSLHPFCSGNKFDIRITSRYDDVNFVNGIMSTAHETGHAMYERNLPEDLIYQPAGQTCSMTLHESQSLFVEMQLCYRKGFFKYLSQIIRDELKLDSDIYSPENLYQMINFVNPSFIRVDSDEVTYPLHIILRYQIEKDLIESNLKVKDIPEIWNGSMEKYLGIKPKNYSEGCLQDIHWPSGSFGYFPCYSLGAILASQLYYKASTEIGNIEGSLANGDFSSIMKWLKQNFHCYGSTMTVRDIIKASTGDDLNVETYIKYLEDKHLAV
jgi:carboxypeptidase Taq